MSASTRAWPAANRVYGASVPSSTRASTAASGRPGTGSAGPSRAGGPSCHQASGSAAAAAAVNWTPVTATGSRSASTSGWATVKPAESRADTPTSRSPPSAPPPPAPAYPAIPTVARARPAQVRRSAVDRPSRCAAAATSSGTTPSSSAAWLTLVRAMPAFCTATTTP